jgi:hypothetical protein
MKERQCASWIDFFKKKRSRLIRDVPNRIDDAADRESEDDGMNNFTIIQGLCQIGAFHPDLNQSDISKRYEQGMFSLKQGIFGRFFPILKWHKICNIISILIFAPGVQGGHMFLMPTADIQDDNGVVAFFAEDFNFASLWRSDPDARDCIDKCDSDKTFEDRESLAPVI